MKDKKKDEILILNHWDIRVIIFSTLAISQILIYILLIDYSFKSLFYKDYLLLILNILLITILIESRVLDFLKIGNKQINKLSFFLQFTLTSLFLHIVLFLIYITISTHVHFNYLINYAILIALIISLNIKADLFLNKDQETKKYFGDLFASIFVYLISSWFVFQLIVDKW